MAPSRTNAGKFCRGPQISAGSHESVLGLAIDAGAKLPRRPNGGRLASEVAFVDGGFGVPEAREPVDSRLLHRDGA